MTYGNPKVDALLAGQISISQGTFAAADFLDLALAALDQGGVSASDQDKVRRLVGLPDTATARLFKRAEALLR